MAQIFTQPVPAPSSKVRDVPPGLDAVVARCTQIKKEMRYAEAGELARELYRIAGARPAVRHASSSRPSLAKPSGLPGMAAMFDAEIQATPVVPKPGSARTFNPMGATLPLMTADRRSEVEKLPPVIDEVDDLAATMPLQPKLLSALRPKPVNEATNAAIATQLLRKDVPIPSPEPAWKREMQRALEVHRQSSSALPTFVADAPNNAVGGTLMLSVDTPEVHLDAAIRSDATGTTSTATSMSQEIRLTLKSRPDPVVVVGRRRRQTQKMLFVAGGFLVTSVALLVAVLLSRRGPGKATAVDVLPNPSSVSVPRPPVSIAPVVLVPSGQTSSKVPKDKPGPVLSASAAAPDAGATNDVRAMPSATAETKALAPATTAKAKPYKPPAFATTAPAGSTCTGIGVFKRCK
jgi:serine/threonine-protein kinase